LPSAAGLALEYFIVQRASVSFWRAFAGLSGQMSAAFSPALIRAFSASVLRWRGAATGEASTIWREARGAFEGDAAALDALRAAARDAGVAN
jgi:hypothetical protein